MVLIHPTAIVDDGAKIGEGTTVGAYSVIGASVVIGKDNQIGPHVVVQGNTRLGDGNKVSPFASIGGPPQDLKYRGENTILEIGNGNTIREYVTLQPGTVHGLGRTSIGDSNLFMACSHVAHDVVVGNNNIFANCASLAGHVNIGSNVILGGLTAVHQFVRLGDLCFLAGGSMVAKDVPPFCLVQGDTACLYGLNTVGLKRAGNSPESVLRLRKIYRQVFHFGAGFKKRVQELLELNADFELGQKLLQFLAVESRRGVCMPRVKGTKAAASGE